MALKGAKAGFGGHHTAGIFSDMTVDGPEMGTLVVIVDRAKNLPNRRTMGKQDPYCAARLGKEAKKTNTDKRGGQTPKWDQELRFTVHDSPDYHNLKVSVFNDDKKTELIGETFVGLDEVLTPGGGQSDTWHGLNCKGKYAGEIRIELTYYDTRPKAEKTPAEKRRESARPGGADGQSPSVGGPRENTPVKRRPLPSDPTGASPSPVHTPGEQPRLAGPQSGPRGYPTPPRQQRPNEYTPTNQRRSYHHDSIPREHRRPLPDASPHNYNSSGSGQHTPQSQQWGALPVDPDGYSPAHNFTPADSNAPQHRHDGFDMSYAAPKPYEVRPIDPLPSNPRDSRAMSQADLRSSRGHAQFPSDLPHSYSAPVIPTHHDFENDARHSTHPHQPEEHPPHQSLEYHQASSSYQEPVHHVEPLRLSSQKSRNDFGQNQMALHSSYQGTTGYADPQPAYDSFASRGRTPSSMQPTVEDEDDQPPPPPVHRSSAPSVVQHYEQPPPNYQDAPAPLNLSRYREDVSHTGFDSPQQPYGANDYSVALPSDRRYSHPRPPMSSQPASRPVSRDAMVPSPLRNEASIPSSLVPGYDNRMSIRNDPRNSGNFQQAPPYDTPSRQRQLSDADYRTPPQYETPPRQHPLAQHQALPPPDSSSYYAPPQEPQRRSPVHDPAPIIKPRPVSPSYTHSPLDDRASRPPARSMPTRKSVSPRPPPSSDAPERRISGVPFNPDSFDVLNPALSRSSNADGRGTSEGGEKGNEVNEMGQIVTFNGRVIDASDHLPIDSWAPEPEPKGTKKDRPARERPGLTGARDLEAARQRERDRKERDRIRNAVNASVGVSEDPGTTLVTSRHQYSNSSGTPIGAGAMVLADSPGSGGRNRLQKRNNRPMSTYTTPTHTPPSNIPAPHTHVLRERENLGGYGSSPGYGAGSRHSIAAPPIPAKIPLTASEAAAEDMTALSLELQSIDIGPGSGGRHRGTARRRYGAY